MSANKEGRVQSFIVLKASRPNPDRTDGYTGPSCAKAGVEPGARFATKEAAQDAADRLTAVNPVGFVVMGVPDV